MRKIAHERQCLIVGFGPQVVVFVILPLQGRCRARSAGRRGVPSVSTSCCHLPCQGRMKGAVPARSGCYACGQILLACGPNLLRMAEREAGISAMFLSGRSSAP